MKVFKITPKISVQCDNKSRRTGFTHTATLLINGKEVEKEKVSYLNRTYEAYDYQSVLQRLIEKSKVLSEKEKAICNKFAEEDQTDYSGMRSTALVAKLGDFFGKDEKEKNDWKKRMLLAGLGNQGISFPEDWGTLSEEEKKRRLDGAIGQLTKNEKT